MTIGDQLTREQANALVPDYIYFLEHLSDWKHGLKFLETFNELKRGNLVITRARTHARPGGWYVVARVSSSKMTWQNEDDGPVVRVSDGKHSWRVDGCDYAARLEAQ